MSFVVAKLDFVALWLALVMDLVCAGVVVCLGAGVLHDMLSSAVVVSGRHDEGRFLDRFFIVGVNFRIE